MSMAQRQRRKEENALTLQIPQRAGQAPGISQALQIPNGFQFEMNGAIFRITSEVTPERQMINLSITMGGPAEKPKRR